MSVLFRLACGACGVEGPDLSWKPGGLIVYGERSGLSGEAMTDDERAVDAWISEHEWCRPLLLMRETGRLAGHLAYIDAHGPWWSPETSQPGEGN